MLSEETTRGVFVHIVKKVYLKFNDFEKLIQNI